MKKLTIALLAFVMTAGLMTGCRKNPNNPGTVPGTTGNNSTIMPSTTRPTTPRPTQPKPSTRPSTAPTDGTEATDSTQSTSGAHARRNRKPY